MLLGLVSLGLALLGLVSAQLGTSRLMKMIRVVRMFTFTKQYKLQSLL